MAPAKAATPPWIKNLRSLLKAQLGGGWSISEQSGKTKVTYRFGDDSRSSVLLPEEFRGSNSVQILNKVRGLNDAMRDRGISLHDAVEKRLDQKGLKALAEARSNLVAKQDAVPTVFEVLISPSAANPQ